MKNWIASLIFVIPLSIAIQAQEAKPQLLHEPASWSFERFAMPPQFAPAITYKGAEELRFAPGMFNKDSATYFTYIFVAQLDEVTAISQADIKDYLLKYYKGLCMATAKDRKLVIDTTQITATIKKKDSPGTIYNATVNIFGVFADGAPVKLNMEVKVLTKAAAKKTWLVFIASPLEKTDPAWKTLYKIQKEFILPK